MRAVRYSLQADSSWNPAVLPDTDGEYVRHEDYTKLQAALYDMVFAYCNKAETLPHTFEIHAVAKAVDILDGSAKEFAKGVLSSLGAGQI